MTEVVEPKPEFQSLTEDAVLAAIAARDPKTPIAIEVARLIKAYKENFLRHHKRLGYLPPHLLQVNARCPIEAVAMRLTTENFREAITQPPGKTVECIERLHAVVDELATQGVDTIFIMAALAEIAVMTAMRDPDHAETHLEGAAGALSAAAHGLRTRKSSS
jgi:hypothetical protein